MFTGLVTEIGVVRTSVGKGDSSVVIESTICVKGIKTGDSIACSGVCLTVTECGQEWFSCDVSSETLSCTTVGSWIIGTKVNLERSLKIGDELGGHFVSGHVDAIACIVERRVVSESILFCCESPCELKNFIAPKGAVALDGVSLTVNECDENRFHHDLSMEETDNGDLKRASFT